MSHSVTRQPKRIELPYQRDPCVWLDRIRPLRYAVLLDSNHRPHSGHQDRYDIVSAAPEWIVKTVSGNTSRTCLATGEVVKAAAGREPFATLQHYFSDVETLDCPELPFSGGLVGFWGYELNHLLEPHRIAARSNALPDMVVGLYLWAVITDHQTETSTLCLHPQISPAKQRRLETLLQETDTKAVAADQREEERFTITTPFTPQKTRQWYDDCFARIQAWIKAGDCYQVNLTRRFSARYRGDLWTAYRALRRITPTPFAAFLDFPELTILSHSPERLLNLQAGQVEARPIKGTIARGSNPAEDRQRAEQLKASCKDRAENLMIVDMLRNDLARSCLPGSIEVPTLFGLEQYANVYHLVSTVTGRLRADRTAFDLLRSAFPGASITGAPKIRAMQIIRELEPACRSVYCGAIGYISSNGRMDVNIPIRTLVADNQNLHTWGGGAIVADSQCDSEYAESFIKVANLMEGLERQFGV